MTIAIVEEAAPPSPSSSAVSWAAVFAGALVAVASTFLLFTLGSGLGFAAAAPWTNPAGALAGLGVAAGVWIVVVQWIASAAGGYLTGRLRTRWIGTHTHEVFFRDTAHGFLAWATATVIIAAGAGLMSAATAPQAAGATSSALATDLAYDADALYRSPAGDPAALSPARAEAMRMLAASAGRGGLSDEDRAYLQASIANRAGVSGDEALRRVSAVAAREHQQVDALALAADKARKAAAAIAIVTALAMFVGAFIASAAAALGGQERDQHP